MALGCTRSIPPLSLCGPTLTIRKFSSVPLGPTTCVRTGRIGPRMLRVPRGVRPGTREHRDLAAGPAPGRRRCSACCPRFVPTAERLITIEDAAELRLAQAARVALEARPANVEGRGEVTVRDLVRNALRMRPDRIIVGEVRGGEALDMLQAMNTGHDGSLSTAHANSARHLLWRLETMALMSDVDLPARTCGRRSPRRSTSSCTSRGCATGAGSSWRSRRSRTCRRASRSSSRSSASVAPGWRGRP